MAVSKLRVLKMLWWPLLSPCASKCAADCWNRKWGGSACFSWISPHLHCSFVVGSAELCQHAASLLPIRELRIKANFVSSVDCTQLMLMPQEHRALCSPASGCQGWWFINHWHPLLEENTEKIWSLRNKVRITSDRKEAYLFRLLPRCCCLAVGTASISCSIPVYLEVLLGASGRRQWRDGYSTKNVNSRSELGPR